MLIAAMAMLFIITWSSGKIRETYDSYTKIGNLAASMIDSVATTPEVWSRHNYCSPVWRGIIREDIEMYYDVDQGYVAIGNAAPHQYTAFLGRKERIILGRMFASVQKTKMLVLLGE